MKALWMISMAICLLTALPAKADPQIESVQQALKDQGFYYGEITGSKDADTTAAIRRFQIRNGLQITGDVNAETWKALGMKLGPAPSVTPRPAATPTPRAAAPPQDTSDLRDNSTVAPPPADPGDPEDAPADPAPGYAPGPRGLNPDTSGVFEGTPFDVAPPDVQQRVIVGAQTLLARQGYYRSGVDGVFGPETEFALRAFQSRYGLEPSGILDMETLAVLGLLPGQREPGLRRPRGRAYRPRPAYAPPGERIYIPR